MLVDNVLECNSTSHSLAGPLTRQHAFADARTTRQAVPKLRQTHHQHLPHTATSAGMAYVLCGVQQSDLAWLPTCGNAATLMAFGLCLVLHPKLTEVRCHPPAVRRASCMSRTQLAACIAAQVDGPRLPPCAAGQDQPDQWGMSASAPAE